MKTILLHVGEEEILPELVRTLVYGLNIRLFGVFGIDRNII